MKADLLPDAECISCTHVGTMTSFDVLGDTNHPVLALEPELGVETTSGCRGVSVVRVFGLCGSTGSVGSFTANAVLPVRGVLHGGPGNSNLGTAV